jgi:hypothetical protein
MGTRNHDTTRGGLDIQLTRSAIQTRLSAGQTTQKKLAANNISEKENVLPTVVQGTNTKDKEGTNNLHSDPDDHERN